jgi:hypothetical protein
MNYSYADINSTGMELLAEGVPFAVENYTDPKKVLKFPMAYGETYTDSYTKEGEAPQSVTWAYSGNGTMITSIGTFTDIVKISNTEGDLMFWNTTPLFPRLIVSSNQLTFLGPQVVGMEDFITGPKPYLYPNPSADEVRIAGIDGPVQWQVVDALGRAVATGNGVWSQGTVLLLDEIGPGAYRILVNNSSRRWNLPLVRN